VTIEVRFKQDEYPKEGALYSSDEHYKIHSGSSEPEITREWIAEVRSKLSKKPDPPDGGPEVVVVMNSGVVDRSYDGPMGDFIRELWGKGYTGVIISVPGVGKVQGSVKSLHTDFQVNRNAAELHGSFTVVVQAVSFDDLDLGQTLQALGLTCQTCNHFPLTAVSTGKALCEKCGRTFLFKPCRDHLTPTLARGE